MYWTFFGRSEQIKPKQVLSYLCSGRPSDNFTENIDQRVERLKINEIFRSDYMMDALPLFDARRAGLKEGMQKGLLAGERNAKFETARKMIGKNISAEITAECTGLSLEEVNKLKE